MYAHKGKDWKRMLFGHLCMAIACAIWGLMAPLGKDAMTHGIPGLEMVTFRVTGGAVCFWLASLFISMKKKVRHEKMEEVSSKDMLRFFFAGMLGIVMNQCCYTIGLSITSPVNASIMTTTMPIITMVLAAVFLKEPVTSKKVMGVFCGAIGACILIMGSSQAQTQTGGVLLGDILCICAQVSFACYLTIFKHLIQRYSVVTCMKWMITYAAIVILPFSYTKIAALPWSEIPVKTYLEAAFVVVGGTFVAYLFSINAQKILRPTVIAMYNYVQPIVSCVVSVLLGLGVFGWGQSLSVVLVFTGVYLVTQSKARASKQKA